MEELHIDNKEKHLTVVIKHQEGFVHTVHIKYDKPIPLYTFINCTAILNISGCTSVPCAEMPRMDIHNLIRK